jgi:hypothetical protein
MTTASGRIPSLSELHTRAAAAREHAAFSLSPPNRDALHTESSAATVPAPKESLLIGGEAMKAGLMWNIVR